MSFPRDEILGFSEEAEPNLSMVFTLQVPTSSSGCFHVCADFQDLISEQWAQIEIKWVS